MARQAERDIENRGLDALGALGALAMRNDVGTAVAPQILDMPISRLRKLLADAPAAATLRDVLKPGRDYRMLSYGLCEGSADSLFLIGPHGTTVYVEWKTPDGRQSPQQAIFQAAVEKRGGIYVIATSVDEAVKRINAKLTARGLSELGE
jgi:hypothetical protein